MVAYLGIDTIAIKISYDGLYLLPSIHGLIIVQEVYNNHHSF